MERFALLSLITIKMPQCKEWRQEIIDLHLQFSQMLIEKELYREAVDTLDNLKEYLQFGEYHDEVGRLQVYNMTKQVAAKIYAVELFVV